MKIKIFEKMKNEKSISWMKNFERMKVYEKVSIELEIVIFVIVQKKGRIAKFYWSRCSQNEASWLAG